MEPLSRNQARGDLRRVGLRDEPLGQLSEEELKEALSEGNVEQITRHNAARRRDLVLASLVIDDDIHPNFLRAHLSKPDAT